MADIYKLFSSKLKERREALKMTQKQLAEALGYSEKNISKWENGLAIAPSVVLPRLASILKTDVNTLLLDDSDYFFLGIDGGGTKTEFALCDKSGKILSNIILEGANPVDIGFARARDILVKGISSVIGDKPTSSVYAFAGIAGGITGQNKEKIHDLLASFGFADFNNGSDAENAVASTLSNVDGTVVIMGTGTVAFTKTNNQLIRHGGWGYLFEEGGSGYAIGRDAIMHTLSIEESKSKDMLSIAITRALGNTGLASIADLYDGGKRKIASLAPIVFECYDNGDDVSRRILDKNMRAIAKLIETSISENNKNVVLTGGLVTRADVIMPMIRAHLKNPSTYNLNVAKERQIFGALKLAKKLKGETTC